MQMQSILILSFFKENYDEWWCMGLAGYVGVRVGLPVRVSFVDTPSRPPARDPTLCNKPRMGFAKGNGTFNKEMICTDTRTYKFVVIEL